MKNRLLYVSLISFVLCLVGFIAVSYAWLIIGDNNKANDMNISIKEGESGNYVIEINGDHFESTDLNILPGEVKIYELTIENLSGAILTILTQNIMNNCYIVATNKTLDYTKMILTDYEASGNVSSFFTDTNAQINNSNEYNLYNGLYLSSGEKVHTITNGTNTINLFYKDDSTIYNTSDYYMNDSQYTNNDKASILSDMVTNANIENAIKYSIELTNDVTINWADKDYIANITTYVLSGNTTYLYLYFDPNAYITYNEVELRNSNPYMFQSLKIDFTAVRD